MTQLNLHNGNQFPDALLRSLPEASDVEKRILSSIIQEPNKFSEEARELGLLKNQFYKISHSYLYDLIMAEHEKGNPTEILSLTQLLRDKDELENIGGVAELTDIATCEILHANFTAYVQLVQQKYEAREIIRYGTKIVNSSFAAQDHDTLLSSINLTGDDFRVGKLEKDAPMTSGEVCRAIADDMIAKKDNHLAEILPTPFRGLNIALGGGYQKGGLHCIVARPSGGKTALAINLATHWIESGIKTLFISFETNEKGIMYRMISHKTKIPQNKLRNPYNEKGQYRISEGENQKFGKAVKALDKQPMTMKKLSKPTRIEFEKVVRSEIKKGTEVIILDYIQKCAASNEAEVSSKKLRIDNFLSTIEQIRASTNATFIILAQASRDADAKPYWELELSHIQDTSQIEQDIDTCVYIMKGRNNKKTKEEEKEEGRDYKERSLYFLKGRDSGDEHIVDFNLHGATATFEYIPPNQATY